MLEKAHYCHLSFKLRSDSLWSFPPNSELKETQFNPSTEANMHYNVAIALGNQKLASGRIHWNLAASAGQGTGECPACGLKSLTD